MLALQVDYEEAAMTFSGGRALTVDEVVNAIIDDVLPKKPAEILLPLGRGWLAKFASVAPQLAGRNRSVLTPQRAFGVAPALEGFERIEAAQALRVTSFRRRVSDRCCRPRRRTRP